MRNRKANQGFTLIELLIVIAIIGILAAVLIPNLLQARNRANDTAVQGYVRNVVTGAESNRDAVTQELPAEGTCAELAGVTADPNPVTSCAYAPDGDTATVTAESSTGATFTFNGTEMTQTAAP